MISFSTVLVLSSEIDRAVFAVFKAPNPSVSILTIDFVLLNTG